MGKRSAATIGYRSLSDFRYEIRRFLNFSEQAARAAGVEPQQHQALLAIKGLPPHKVATVGTLSERLQIRHHSAVELIDRLEAKRLIRRSRAASDRRAVVITLTVRGGKLLRDLTRQHHTALEKASRKLLRALISVMKNEDSAHSFRGTSSRGTQRTKQKAQMATHHPEKGNPSHGKVRKRKDS
jgi:DNA-binding MarR family transcriptional regulator